MDGLKHAQYSTHTVKLNGKPESGKNLKLYYSLNQTIFIHSTTAYFCKDMLMMTIKT